MKLCDLHTHSVYSDGTYTPKEIIDSAIAIGLSAVALCDHNTVDGLAEFIKAAEGKNIEVVPGVEFSVDYNGKELHLLALYISKEHFQAVTDLVEESHRRKEQSNLELIASLNKAGYLIDYEPIKNTTPNGRVNRAHIAEELTNRGYTESIRHAFKTLLSTEAGYYKAPERLSFSEVLEFIISIGAVPVLAHPFLNLNEEELKTLLPLAKEKGLVGMECYYSLYNSETTEKSLKLADKHSLKYSGGSDFHGEKKPDISLGYGKGELRIPYRWAEELKKSTK